METEQNDKAEVTPVQLWIAISVPVFLFSFVLIVMGLIFPFRFVFLLCVGWASYLVRTLSRLTISPSQTLMFLSTQVISRSSGSYTVAEALESFSGEHVSAAGGQWHMCNQRDASIFLDGDDTRQDL